MKDIEVKAARGDGEATALRGKTQDTIVQVDHFVCAVWISGIARGQFRSAGVCQRLFEVPLSGGVHGGTAEQSADGILSVRPPW